MKTSKKTAKPRNPVAVAMMTRYGQTTTTHRDRRAPRGGSKNKVREFLKECE
jgi:hypothetical protein